MVLKRYTNYIGVGNMETFKQSFRLTSNCCDGYIYPDTDICGICHEHCCAVITTLKPIYLKDADGYYKVGNESYESISLNKSGWARDEINEPFLYENQSEISEQEYNEAKKLVKPLKIEI